MTKALSISFHGASGDQVSFYALEIAVLAVVEMPVGQAQFGTVSKC